MNARRIFTMVRYLMRFANVEECCIVCQSICISYQSLIAAQAWRGLHLPYRQDLIHFSIPVLI